MTSSSRTRLPVYVSSLYVARDGLSQNWLLSMYGVITADRSKASMRELDFTWTVVEHWVGDEFKLSGYDLDFTLFMVGIYVGMSLSSESGCKGDSMMGFDETVCSALFTSVTSLKSNESNVESGREKLSTDNSCFCRTLFS